MKELIRFGLWFALGYLFVEKCMPAVQAKLEALDIDEMWEVWNDEEEEMD